MKHTVFNDGESRLSTDMFWSTKLYKKLWQHETLNWDCPYSNT